MKLTAIPRITLGLVSLSVCLLLVFDLVLHLFPSEVEVTRQVRERLVNGLAIQAAALVQARDVRAVEHTFMAMQSHDPDIVSIGLRRQDGALIAQAGDHARHWSAPDTTGAEKTEQRVRGILSGQQRWGALEITFKPAKVIDARRWLNDGLTRLIILFSVMATVIFYLYLRRMLQHLDPSAAVPERVRGAFDALSEGVLVVDPKENILLANKSVQTLVSMSSEAGLLGKKASELSWLRPVQAQDGNVPAPWITTMRSKQPARGQAFEVVREGQPVSKVVVNCSPLLDEKGAIRGCLITLDDVTALERSHEQLLEVLADLAASKRQLEHKNTELEELASRDPLSACLNRRAFFEGFARVFKHMNRVGGDLICIMADIDHFKLINDRYGHGVGDEAIKRFAEILRGSVRQEDLVGRYGGEEFCVVVAGLSMERAMELAETMRARVADAKGVGAAAGHQVTMSASFGVSMLRRGVQNEAELIDQADQAMYIAKQSGRNRVIAYTQPDKIEKSVTEEATS